MRIKLTKITTIMTHANAYYTSFQVNELRSKLRSPNKSQWNATHKETRVILCVSAQFPNLVGI